MDNKAALECWHKMHPLEDTGCLPTETSAAILSMYDRAVMDGIDDCRHCGDGLWAIQEIDRLNWFIMGWKKEIPDAVKNETIRMNREKDPEWVLYQKLRKKFANCE